MNVYRPKGRRIYHVYFRVRDRQRASGWRQVFRSCETESYTEATERAARILAEEIEAKNSPTPVSPEATAKPAINSDPTIEEVIALHRQWIAEAAPGETRPSLSTAHNYHLRLRQLCRILGVETTAELKEAVKGLTHDMLDVTPENFVPLMRNAAGIFRRACMRYYVDKGVTFEPPLTSGPPVIERPFTAIPTFQQLHLIRARMRERAIQNPRDYLLFLLVLDAGLRVQEATHVQWRHVLPYTKAYQCSSPSPLAPPVPRP